MELHGYGAKAVSGSIVFRNIVKSGPANRRTLSEADLRFIIKRAVTADKDYMDTYGVVAENMHYSTLVHMTCPGIISVYEQSLTKATFKGMYGTIWEKAPLRLAPDSGGVLWVLFDTDTPIGMCSTVKVGSTGVEVHNVNSLELTRKGVGTAMMQRLTRRVLDKPLLGRTVTILEVYCLTPNIAANKCYSRIADVQKKGECFAKFSRAGGKETQFVIGKAVQVMRFLKARMSQPATLKS